MKSYKMAADQATAWEAVFDTLQEVAPGWTNRSGSGMENAINAIRDLARKAAHFDAMVAMASDDRT